MKTILNHVKKRGEELTPIKQFDEKTHLDSQKEYIDRKIKRYERKEIDIHVFNSLRNVLDIKDAVSELQHALNVVWKRTQQVEEELRSVLEIPKEPLKP